MNLIDQIDDATQRLNFMKDRLKQAQEANNKKDIEIFSARVFEIGAERYCLKGLYLMAIAEKTGKTIEDLMSITGAHIDMDTIRHDYPVVVHVE
jgi:hypothetical protein